MRTLFDKPRTGMALRDYQYDAVAGIEEKLSTHGSTLVVMATGLGKTVVMAEDARRVVESGKRVLALAHRRELIYQLAETMKRLTGVTPDIEMAEERAVRGSLRSPIVCASKDTLRYRLDNYDPAEFGRVYTDEAHRAVAKSYTRIYKHFDGVPHVGVTATPDRHDERALGRVYESVAYEMHIVDAINRGWLVPVQQQFVKVKSLALKGIKTIGGDYQESALAELSEQDVNVLKMSNATMELCGKERCLIFCVRVRHAEKVAAVINERGRKAACVHGKMQKQEREEIFRRFAEGDIQYLANVGLATEGWDDPATDGKGVQFISMMRPTRSRAMYAQMLGRGTRTLPGVLDGLGTAMGRKLAIAASSKPCVTMLDFVGAAADHKMVHATDVLGGKMDDAVVFRAKQNARKGDGSGDTLQDLHAARIELEKEDEDRRLAALKVDVKYDVRDVNAPDSWSFAPRPAKTGPAMATKVQIEKLGLYGIDARKMTQYQASREYAKLDRASEKQKKWLRRAGVPEDAISSMGKAEAGAWMREIKANNWRLPRDHPWLQKLRSTSGRK